MPSYDHRCTKCNEEWEESYKITDPVPTKCPKCGTDGSVKRLISICSGKVELYGHELTQKLRADGKKLAKEARKDETLMANIIGEARFDKGR